jgi:hypothetical protein
MWQFSPESEVDSERNLLDEVAVSIGGLQLHLNHSQHPPPFAPMGSGIPNSFFVLRNVEDGDALTVDDI